MRALLDNTTVATLLLVVIFTKILFLLDDLEDLVASLIFPSRGFYESLKEILRTTYLEKEAAV